MAFQGVLPYGTRGGPTKPTPVVNNPGSPNTGPGGYYGSGTNAKAVSGAAQFKQAMGLPSFEDIFKKLEGAGGTAGGGTIGGRYEDKIYDRSAANAGVGTTQAELAKWRQDLVGQKANLDRVRQDIRNPTQTEGFKNVMRLSDERLGHQQEQDRQDAAFATSRRGFVGGYSPEQGEMERRQATALAGGQAAIDERAAQQALFGGEADLYGADIGGYNSAMDAYTNLASTLASTPTKSFASDTQANPLLGLYGDLLGNLSGGFGDIFGTASKNAQYDENNRREDSARYWDQFKRPAGSANSGAGSSRSGLG